MLDFLLVEYIERVFERIGSMVENVVIRHHGNVDARVGERVGPTGQAKEIRPTLSDRGLAGAEGALQVDNRQVRLPYRIECVSEYLNTPTLFAQILCRPVRTEIATNDNLQLTHDLLRCFAQDPSPRLV